LLLEADGPAGRLPFVVSLSSWDTRRVGFSDWLKEQLATTYPTLTAVDGTGRRAADILIDGDRILPILDGLDEMPLSMRAKALVALRRMEPSPLVITCRIEDYKNLLGLGGRPTADTPLNRPLPGAAVVEIQRLSPEDIVTYLRSDLGPSELRAWEKVFEEITHRSDGPLATELSTPLMCFLARTAYSRRSNKPAELTECAKLSSAEFRERLMERFVPAVFDDASGGRHIARWDADRATRWLSYLARSLDEDRNLTPWKLHESMTHVGFVRSVVSGLVLGVILGIAIGVTGALVSAAMGLAIHGLALDCVPHPTMSALPAIGLSIAGLSALALFSPKFIARTDDDGRALSYPELGWHYGLGLLARFLIGFVGSTGVVLLLALPENTGVILLIAFLGGLTVSGLSWSLSSWSYDWRTKRRLHRLQINLRKLPDALVYGLGGGLVTGLGAAAIIGLSPSVLVAASAVLVGVVINLLDTRIDTTDADQAVAVLRSDRHAIVLQLASLGVVVGVFAQLGFPTRFADAAVFGIGLGVGAGIGLGAATTPSGGLPRTFPSSVWIRYITAKWWLVVHRKVPVRLLAFLDEAHRLGVLRKAGAVYQFRHIDVQKHLSQSDHEEHGSS
jgi:hypothetical protein